MRMGCISLLHELCSLGVPYVTIKMELIEVKMMFIDKLEEAANRHPRLLCLLATSHLHSVSNSHYALADI